MKKLVVFAMMALAATTSVAATTAPASAMSKGDVAFWMATTALDAWMNEHGGNSCQCSSMNEFDVNVEVNFEFNVKVINVIGDVYGDVNIQ